jgi:hypothetical protein
METIVAESFAVGLLMPEIQSILQTFSLIRAGKINDGRGTATERSAAASVKIIRSGGIADVQIKMSMGVNKTGEEQATFYINDVICLNFQIAAKSNDFFVFYQ